MFIFFQNAFYEPNFSIYQISSNPNYEHDFFRKDWHLVFHFFSLDLNFLVTGSRTCPAYVSNLSDFDERVGTGHRRSTVAAYAGTEL